MIYFFSFLFISYILFYFILYYLLFSTLLHNYLIIIYFVITTLSYILTDTHIFLHGDCRRSDLEAGITGQGGNMVVSVTGSCGQFGLNEVEQYYE